MAGVLGVTTIGFYGTLKDYDVATNPGTYRIKGKLDSGNNPPFVALNYGILTVDKSEGVIMQTARNLTNETYSRFYSDNAWSPWQRIDNFGYNSLAELSSGIDSVRPANNSKSFSASDSVEVDTGITKMGLYRWGFDKLGYANPMYFIVTANHGVTVLNKTWFSDNVTFRMGDGKLYFTYGATANVYLTYLG